MNKVALITGGGRGIGAATARKLAQQGYVVCINFLRDEQSALDLSAQIKQQGGQVLLHQADVSQLQQVEEMFAVIQRKWGEVTHLVNNVGILFEKMAFTDIRVERFRQVMDVNVLSAFICSQVFVKQHAGGGGIVNVSSAASRTGAPFEYVDYAASKGAMDSLTKGLSLELAAKQIRVNGVRPGFIKTEIHADGGEPDRVNRMSSQIPMLRGGEPEEVANAIAWLLSEEASYVTGSFIDIAGGK